MPERVRIQRDAERLFEVLATCIIIRKLLEESHDRHKIRDYHESQ
jgi:hypothetical protein